MRKGIIRFYRWCSNGSEINQSQNWSSRQCAHRDTEGQALLFRRQDWQDRNYTVVWILTNRSIFIDRRAWWLQCWRAQHSFPSLPSHRLVYNIYVQWWRSPMMLSLLSLFYSLPLFRPIPVQQEKELELRAYTIRRLSNGRRMSNFWRRNRLGPFRLELIVCALYNTNNLYLDRDQF